MTLSAGFRQQNFQGQIPRSWESWALRSHEDSRVPGGWRDQESCPSETSTSQTAATWKGAWGVPVGVVGVVSGWWAWPRRPGGKAWAETRGFGPAPRAGSAPPELQRQPIRSAGRAAPARSGDLRAAARARSSGLRSTSVLGFRSPSFLSHIRKAGKCRTRPTGTPTSWAPPVYGHEGANSSAGPAR